MNLNQFIDIVKPYTMTSVERIEALYNSLEYIRNNNIPGDIVECGVWKGGNILGIISYLHYYRDYRNVWLYDTFSGMTPASHLDTDLNGHPGNDWNGMCECSIQEVKNLLSTSYYPTEKLFFIEGDVCHTLPLQKPSTISILRLDTDWYESTKCELFFLYPIITNKGVLIIDDYGHWQGCKKAVDEYISSNNLCLNIEYIDYTCIRAIKL